MEGHIWIDGVITENYHLEVKRQLQANKEADTIILHIQSPGGSVYAGYNTYHLLKSSGKRIKTIIEGEAQSIATFIALAGETVEIRNPSVFMIHNPFAGLEGDADKMLNGASELRNIENDMAMIYSAKTKLPMDKIKEMMKNETSMNAAQAVQFGFADRAIDPLRMVALGKKQTMENTETSTVSMFEKLQAGLDSLVEAFSVKNAEPEPAPDKGVEEAPAQPEPAKAMALPAGEYPLENGLVIIVDEMGMIVEVKGSLKEAPMPEPMPEAPMPEDNMEAKLAAIQAELDAMKATAQASEAKATQAVQALGTIKNEFEVLKKKTVGDDSAPMAGAKFDRTPVSAEASDSDAEMKKEIFAKLGLSHLIK
jgi:ATP-dependent Clp endopeptidase proteolytic subunit ClpP